VAQVSLLWVSCSAAPTLCHATRPSRLPWSCPMCCLSTPHASPPTVPSWPPLPEAAPSAPTLSSVPHYCPIPRAQLEPYHFLFKASVQMHCLWNEVQIPWAPCKLSSMVVLWCFLSKRTTQALPAIHCSLHFLSWMSDSHDHLPPGHLLLHGSWTSQALHALSKIHYFPLLPPTMALLFL
jgi:hypothetical protein